MKPTLNMSWTRKMLTQNLAFILVVALCTSGFGQSDNHQSLTIGEQVPPSTMQYIIEKSNGNISTQLYILDFWATTCANCIAAFPKMESLQRKFKNDIRVILINSYENQKRIDDRFEQINQRLIQQGTTTLDMPQLPNIAGDSILKSMFPHLSVPHHVWINHEGIVLAITDGLSTNEMAIREYIAKGSVKLSMKTDYTDLDISRPLFLNEHIEKENVRHYSLLLKGHIGNFKFPSKQPNRYFVGNRSLYTLYTFAAEKVVPFLKHGREIVEVNRPNTLFSRDNNQKITNENLYTYDFIVPEESSDSLYYYAIQDLNRYTEFYGQIEQRKMHCHVLVNVGKDKAKLVTKGGKYVNSLRIDENLPLSTQTLKNGSWMSFMSWLSNTMRNLESDIILVDETGLTENIDITISNVSDLASLKKALNRYDLDLVETVRELNIFVLRDK